MVNTHLERCLEIVLDATNGGGRECCVRRVPQRWSVVEVVEHLARAYSGTAKGFERCLEKDTQLSTPLSWKNRLRAFAVVEMGYFPSGREAPKHILPTGELDLPAALAAVRHGLARLDDAAIKTRDRFGSTKVLDHPILGAFTVDEWLKFHVVHTRHHEKQIRARR